MTYEQATAAIRAEAKRLLEAGEVRLVIGWKAGRRGTAHPFFAETPEQADSLVFTPACVNNLTLYLTKRKGEEGKVAVVLKGCDLKALAGLVSESQVRRDSVHVIGVSCPGVERCGETAAKCAGCTVRVPEGADFIAGALDAIPAADSADDEEIARLEAMSPAERWEYWREHFSRCVRCMACRQVCPFCYCERCLCDRNRPQAVEGSTRPSGTMAWHLVRAMHLSGRCAGCAECERACPMDIPLNLLNRKMANELKDLYGFEAGTAPREKGPLNDYAEDDDQSFIR